MLPIMVKDNISIVCAQFLMMELSVQKTINHELERGGPLKKKHVEGGRWILLYGPFAAG